MTTVTVTRIRFHRIGLVRNLCWSITLYHYSHQSLFALFSKALEDPDSGDIYYANEITGVTTWDRPEEQSVNGYEQSVSSEHSKPDSSSQQRSYNSQLSRDQDDGHNANYNIQSTNSDFDVTGQNSIDDDDGLPEGWYSAIDPNSNERYYCNEETGETQWQRPEHEEMSQGSSQLDEDNQNLQEDEDNSEVSEELPEGWEAILDPSSGDYYYYNADSGTTSWDKPWREIVNEAVEQVSLESNVCERSDEELPENWFAVEDPLSGDTYYYNEVTNETSWEVPTDASNIMSSLSVQENIVYEEDSVTSSKY